MLQSVGVSTEKLTSVLGSSYQKIPGSIQDAHRFSCDTSKHDARRADAEIVKESATGPGDFLYPVLKVLNEQYLNVDIQSGGELFSYMVGSNDSEWRGEKQEQDGQEGYPSPTIIFLLSPTTPFFLTRRCRLQNITEHSLHIIFSYYFTPLLSDSSPIKSKSQRSIMLAYSGGESSRAMPSCIVMHKKPTPTPSTRSEKPVLSHLLKRRPRQPRDSPDKAMEALQADRIHKITPETVEKLRAVFEEGVAFPRLTVEPEEFHRWHSMDNPLPVEYSNKTKKIILIAPGNWVHQMLEGVMSSWFREVAGDLSSTQEEFSACSQCEVDVADGTKIPDAALVSQDISRKGPLACVEVGFTETLEKLFNHAERLLQSSCDLVILIKVFEKDTHRADEFPWGINPANLQSLNHDGRLAPAILNFYDAKNLLLLGTMDVHIYLCRKARPAPKSPSYRLGQSGAKQLRVRLEGKLFSLPIEALEDALEEATRVEKKRRVYKLIKKASDRKQL